MKTELGIKNFKIFDDQGVNIKFNPITILTGANGSGKSSITKALIILQDYMKRLNESLRSDEMIGAVPFEISNSRLRIGSSYKDSINRDSKSDTISMSYQSHLFSSEYIIKTTLRFQPSYEDSYYKGGWLKQLTLTCNDEIFLDAFFDENCKIDHINCSIPTSMRKAFSEYCEYCLLSNWVSYINKQAHLTASEGGIDLGIEENDYIEKCAKIDSLAKDIIANKQHLANSLISLPHSGYEYYLRLTKIKYYETPKILELDDIIKDESLEKCLDSFKRFNIFFFFPMLEKFVGKTKVEALEIIRSYLPVDLWDEYPEYPYSIVERICEDFQNSEFDSFIDYYRHIEKSELDDIGSWALPVSPRTWNMGAYGTDDLYEYYLSPKLTTYKHNLVSSSKKFYQSIKSVMDINIDYIYGLNIHDFIHDTWSAAYSRDVSLREADLSEIKKKQKVSFDLLSFYMCNVQVSRDELSLRNYFDPVIHDINVIGAFWSNKLYEHYVKFLQLVIQDSLSSYPSNLEYIGNFRAKIERVYSLGEGSDDLFNQSIKEYLLYRSKYRNVNKDKTALYPGEFINKWLRQLGIARELRFKVDDDGAGAKLYLISHKNGSKIPLADEGYGVTQVIAFLMHIELAILEGTKTLCLEEPESGLHPDYQSKLAEIFYDAYKLYDLHFIVETHSEYLIRAFQAIVARTVDSPKDLENLPVIVHYVDKGGQTYDLEFTESGRFNRNFGPGFFDEAGRLCVEILLKEKRMKDGKNDELFF